MSLVFFWIAFVAWVLQVGSVRFRVAERRSNRRNADDSRSPSAVFGQVQPREPGHLPPARTIGSAFAIVLEVVRVAVKGQAVDLDERPSATGIRRRRGIRPPVVGHPAVMLAAYNSIEQSLTSCTTARRRSRLQAVASAAREPWRPLMRQNAQRHIGVGSCAAWSAVSRYYAQPTAVTSRPRPRYLPLQVRADIRCRSRRPWLSTIAPRRVWARWRSAVPPRCGHPLPLRGPRLQTAAQSRRVGERPVVDEVDAGEHRRQCPDRRGGRQRPSTIPTPWPVRGDDAVMAAQVVIEHEHSTCERRTTFPSCDFGVHLAELHQRAEIA